jgi:hypothetical protein
MFFSQTLQINLAFPPNTRKPTFAGFSMFFKRFTINHLRSQKNRQGVANIQMAAGQTIPLF